MRRAFISRLLELVMKLQTKASAGSARAALFPGRTGGKVLHLQVRDGIRKQVAVLDGHADVASGQVVDLHVTVSCRSRIHHRFLTEEQRIQLRYAIETAEHRRERV